MSIYATVAEFEAMNNMAENLGFQLECYSYSNGACQWGVIYAIKRDGRVVLSTDHKPLLKTLLTLMSNACVASPN